VRGHFPPSSHYERTSARLTRTQERFRPRRMTSGEQLAGPFAGGAVSTLFPYGDHGYEACVQNGGIPRSNSRTRTVGGAGCRARGMSRPAGSTTSAISAAETTSPGCCRAIG
jgi:hypothetical protein